ncbi:MULTISPECIES: hypothetical protein [Okeania]|nr:MULTISPECIES: hypothetical protein [Okeania]NEP07611.1 hypothetical protein [Okeania sp. SIO4D6]NET12654.1 hypothetical protein [Okeania sp. SIO1H6]NEP73049.1 hypothetical protein [Okeania sp. SIO2G5]NEP93912.1 hypothetical protein [Okeania sp. SIO2F5]NEQ91734.1 hypothetical protein [Okeania sp. SIO2G4]
MVWENSQENKSIFIEIFKYIGDRWRSPNLKSSNIELPQLLTPESILPQ